MTAKCRIICDSTCDLTAARAEELGVKIVSLTYTEAGKEDGLNGVDDLFQTRSAHDFYEAIRRGAMPMTSQPSQAVFDAAFQEAYESGEPTVLFTISSGISGTYNGAVTALDRLKEAHPGEDIRIYVVDTLVASTALNLFIEEACVQRDAGLNAEELVLWAKEARYHVHIMFMVENLDSLHRGGRVPKGVAVIGDALNVKALLHFNLDGTLGMCGMARGRKKGMRKLVDHLVKGHETDTARGRCFSIGDADVADDGYQLASAVRAKLGEDVTVFRPTIGPTIGCHVGPGMVAACFWGSDRRNGK